MDNTISDLIYYIDKAIEKKVIDLDTYLEVRKNFKLLTTVVYK